MTNKTKNTGFEIAIIGMTCRLPEAKNIEEFKNNLFAGKECIRFFSPEELQKNGSTPAQIENPNLVPGFGYLDDIEMFDAGFFQYTPREAEIIDPQKRLFMECAWEALENAGYNPAKYPGAIGVFAGEGINTYLLDNISGNPHLIDLLGNDTILSRNCNAYLSTNISYKFDLRGPSFTVHTNCSTSLVAIHLACQSLLNNECDLALAGGVTVNTPQDTGYIFQEGGICSSDGHCRAFDHKADGTVFGNGVGVVILKKLDEAVQDGDFIYAVIKGSSVNNDGANKANYNAPSVNGQTSAILETLSFAEVPPESIAFLEAHGTGTKMGDPIEISALTKAYRQYTDKKQFCAIGSVKSNVGHLDAAAGVTSFIKSVLALYHQKLIPSLHYEKANPEIDFENSPFYVNTKLLDWPQNGYPRRAAVNSLGFGGTNAHTILEEAPKPATSGASRSKHLLLLSAKTDTALEKMTENLLLHLKTHRENQFADIVYTLQVGRKKFEHRRMVVCDSVNDVIQSLEKKSAIRVVTQVQKKHEQPVVFMFPGQGAQYVNMGQMLYTNEPIFGEMVDRCAEILLPKLGEDIRKILYPQAGFEKEATQRLKQTIITQPALFVVEYALAKLLQEWGIFPQAMIGHSVGEYVAACLAGVFSVEDALHMIAERGRLIQELPGGTMLAVQLSVESIMKYVNEEVAIAAVNGPDLCVISGRDDAMKRVEARLRLQSIDCMHLHTSHAFHSPMMEPILEKFQANFSNITLKAPQIPIMSTVTGDWVKPGEINSPTYWCKNVRQTVKFNDGISRLLADKIPVFLEVGPGRTLGTLSARHPKKEKDQVMISTMRHPQEKKDDLECILTALGKMWLAGVEPDWDGFYRHEKRHRVPLPTYPFERKRYWIDPQKDTQHLQIKSATKKSVTDWFYQPVWKRTASFSTVMNGDSKATCWLIFIDESHFGESISNLLSEQGLGVVQVLKGEQFKKVNSNRYFINPGEESDYHQLFKELKNDKKLPDQVLHFWHITFSETNELRPEEIETLEISGFYSLLFWVRAFGGHYVNEKANVSVIANNLLDITGDELIVPEKALVMGLVKVIPQEYSNVNCRVIDVGVTNNLPEKSLRFVTNQVLSEHLTNHSERLVGFRGKYRWVQDYDPVELNNAQFGGEKLRKGGIYLITGGLGNIGLVLAEHLAATMQAKLVLTGRTILPERDQWHSWPEQHPATDKISQKIHAIQKIEDSGGEVAYFALDSSDMLGMIQLVQKISEVWGEINGVFHSAGLLGDDYFKAIPETNIQTGKTHFNSKLWGTKVIYEIFKARTPDFVVLMSSLSSVLGGLGHAFYSAANSYLDAFSQKMNQTNSRWISINWDEWKIPGEGKSSVSKKTNLPDMAISSNEGIQALELIFQNLNLPQIAVSTYFLAERLSRWIFMDWSKSENGESDFSQEKIGEDTAIILKQLGVEASPLEIKIIQFWRQVLGIEEIGLADNFFDMGATSLNIIQVNELLKKELNQYIPVDTMFTYPTIKSLAEFLGGKQEKMEIFSFDDRDDKITQGQGALQKRREIGSIKNDEN